MSRGTFAMYSINYIPAAVLGLSFFMLTVMYSLWGFIGFCFFYRIAEDIIPNNSKLKSIYIFPTILFLPSLHFWSAGVGKDTLLFTCIGGFIYAMMNLQRRYIVLIITIVISLLVRPHITLFLFMSFAAAYLFNTKIQVYKRVLLSLLLAGVCIALIPKLMEYAKLEELSVNSYNQFAQEKAQILSRANVGSRVDMSSYPLPLKIFTFLYRPLPFDVHNMSALMAAVENVILLYLTYLAIRRRPKYLFKRAPFIIKGMFFLLLIGATMSSISLGNLGIMIRMRNMFLPCMLIYILWSLSYHTQLALNKRDATFPKTKAID